MKYNYCFFLCFFLRSVHVRVRPLAACEKESAWRTVGGCKIAPAGGGDDVVMDNVFDDSWTTAQVCALELQSAGGACRPRLLYTTASHSQAKGGVNGGGSSRPWGLLVKFKTFATMTLY